MKKALLLEQIAAAKVSLTEAEAELERALAQIQAAPRAEKVTISAVVGGAFEKVRAARTTVADVEERLTGEAGASAPLRAPEGGSAPQRGHGSSPKRRR